MIDWFGVFAGGLWVLGLALMLSVVSYARWVAFHLSLGVRQVWEPGFDLLLNGGAFLTAFSLFLHRGGDWERWLALGAAIGLAALAGHDVLLMRAQKGLARRPRDLAVQREGSTVGLPAMWPRAAIWPALAACLFVLMGSDLAFVGVVPVLGGWLVGRVFRGRAASRSPVDWPLIMVLATALVGFAVSVDRSLSLDALRNLLSGMALCVATAAWATSRRRMVLATTLLVLIGVAFALLAPFVQTRWMANKYFAVPEALHRVTLLAEAIHPNVLAGALALAAPVVLSVLFWSRGNQSLVLSARMQAGLILATIAMSLMLILSQSRGALVAMGAVSLVLAVLRWQRARLLVPGVAVLAAVVVCRLGLERTLNLLLAGTGFQTFEGRIELWSRAIYMIQDFSFTGIGLGTYQVVAPLMYPFFLFGPDAKIPHAHNLFLQVGVDLGIPGLIGFLSVLMLGMLMAWQVYRTADDAALRSLAAGLLGSHMALVIHGLSDAPVWTSKPAFVPWMVTGLTVALWRMARVSPAAPATAASVRECAGKRGEYGGG